MLSLLLSPPTAGYLMMHVRVGALWSLSTACGHMRVGALRVGALRVGALWSLSTACGHFE